MDVYDDDPIRKDAVQHENLVVIQAGKHRCMQAGRTAVVLFQLLSARRIGVPSGRSMRFWRTAKSWRVDMRCGHRMLHYDGAALHAGTAVAILSRRASFSSGCLPS